MIEKRWPGQDARGVRAYGGRDVPTPKATPGAAPVIPPPPREARKPQPAR